MIQKYFEESYVVICWDEEARCVFIKWNHPEDREFQIALEKGLELLIEKGSTKWLGDISNIGIMLELGSAWSDVHFYPKAVRAGMKHMALIATEQQLAKLPEVTATGQYGGIEYIYHYFTNIGDAKSWLTEFI